MYEKLEDCNCPQYPEKGDHLESCKYFATKTRVVKAFSKPRKAGLHAIENEIYEKRDEYIILNEERPRFLILSRDKYKQLVEITNFYSAPIVAIHLYLNMEICIRQQQDNKPFLEVAY